MKRINSLVFDKQTLAGSSTVYSDIVDIRHMVVGTVQYVLSGSSMAGSIEVQMSCDEGNPNDETGASIVNWFQYQAPVSLTSTGVFFIPIPSSGYVGANWIRIKLVQSSGVGTISINANFKGA